ncbi:sigma-70 family RNA polymerase sigma factor [Streptomyces sp. NPDC058548]|uniref:sigma-70 family RNA polymerase sigma factor n=1 Tax=Streptomyces sp. NPDC058548 TaxID=3346545 RepID=UPI00366619F6
MDRTPLPEPFADLVGLAFDPANPTVEQAQALGRALTSVPQLQAWLREQRQLTVRALLDGEDTKETLAPRLELSPQRVADIASGHGRKKPKPATD